MCVCVCVMVIYMFMHWALQFTSEKLPTLDWNLFITESKHIYFQYSDAQQEKKVPLCPKLYHDVMLCYVMSHHCLLSVGNASSTA